MKRRENVSYDSRASYPRCFSRSLRRNQSATRCRIHAQATDNAGYPGQAGMARHEGESVVLGDRGGIRILRQDSRGGDAVPGTPLDPRALQCVRGV